MRRLALSALIALSALSAVAQTKPPKFKFMAGPKAGGGEVKWSVAEHGRVELEKDEYVLLEGDVKLEYQDIKVAGDKVTYNFKTRDVVAEGHVVIDQGPTRVTANQAVYNLDSKTGTFFNATGTMDPSMYFSGDRIEKVDEDTYRLTNGVFTSCDLDRPAWSFHVGSADVTMDDYAHMRDISFRAKNIPVFWAPRLVWPTKRDRSQGFLIPRILFSNTFGTRVETGYFLPMGESADATIYADVNTANYNGAGLNLRYVPSENVKLGELTAYAVNNPQQDRVEWRYAYKHAQENLPGGFRGVVDVQDYSNLDFFREYDRDPRLHTLSNIYSSGYLTKNRPTYSLNILADRRDIVFATTRQRYEQLPSLQFRMYPQRVANTPVYFSLESSASQLRTSSVDFFGKAEESANYGRADLFPTLSLQVRTPSWFSIKPQISLRETYYTQSQDETTRETIDESLNRRYAQGQVELVGPSFSRVYNRSAGGFSKFKHVIEPRFRYVYTSNVSNQDRILRFDTVDSPFLPIVQDSVEYSLTQRLLGKESGPSGNAREVLSFSLRQSVALSDPFTKNSGGSFPGSSVGTHKFTPLTANLHANPYQSITVDANATFGNVSHQLDQVSFSANLVGTGDRADKYLGVTWFASFLQPNQTTGDASQVRFNAGSNIREKIRADIQLNFDAKDAKFLEQRYLLGWTGSCYGVALEYRPYRVFVPNEITGAAEERLRATYGIAITLKNVGTIGTH